MQRGRVLNFSKYRVLEFLKNNSYLLVCFLFLSIGAILGLFVFCDIKFVQNIVKHFFGDYLSLRQNGNFLKIIIFSFLNHLLIYLSLFMSGTSLFGVVTVPAVLLTCGGFCGAAVSYLYSQYALKGVAFNAVIFLPSTLVFLLFFVFAAMHSLVYSVKLARLTLPNSINGDLFLQFKDYSLKFLLLVLGSASASLIDGLTATSMLRFFEL